MEEKQYVSRIKLADGNIVDVKDHEARSSISNIENNYAKVSGNKLVYGQSEAEMTIIFDCGGVE